MNKQKKQKIIDLANSFQRKEKYYHSKPHNFSEQDILSILEVLTTEFPKKNGIFNGHVILEVYSGLKNICPRRIEHDFRLFLEKLEEKNKISGLMFGYKLTSLLTKNDLWEINDRNYDW